MNTQYAADADGVEPSVVNQAADRLRMHSELLRNVAHADQSARVSAFLGQSRHSLSGPRGRCYRSSSLTLAVSSRMEREPSNFDLMRPSPPIRNVQGSVGRSHSRTQRFSPFCGLFPL